MRHILSIAIAALLIVGCGNQAASTSQPTNTPSIIVDPAELIGSRWNVLTINGQPIIGPNPLPLTIDSASQVSGNGGCNGYGGGITIDGSKLTIGPLVSTLMACAEADLQAQEGSLLQSLEKVRSYQQTETTLSLLDDQGTVVVTLARQP
ncbi:MAG TPA: META domain-containing protein [Herpetosiphon sp.]|uniref:DUF306 domain-containing protein n=1 Tax=Herpetosiphon aurantiacus (strain ATCC 23779 / DSM 785 / 114-95) TaxID=316274 RepID=A9AVD2_HERA2|nr:META domain-containing protein [Herpetosiphon sp.]ABX04623.1 protein of unknown function DUF306 Meta and HslJ [Herpetosiphon aurantiacus DSM 785]HBW48665.1 META domain-containing protein [Herpetosiphon sp.]